MRARTISDCERDLKGIHSWVCIGIESASDGDFVLWCKTCGAISYSRYPKSTHPSQVKVKWRVKEEPQ